ncbi:MAG: hypothetical protein PHD15_07215 [Clostridia bacterium]|nr:hypothetical protein [Clostridia bacterium]
MKKEKKVIENNDEKLSNRIIDLFLCYQIEDSHHQLRLIDMQIKGCQMQLNFLENSKPFWLQKKKLEEHNKKIEDLENKIFKYYQKMNEGVDLIQKMQKSMCIKN